MNVIRFGAVVLCGLLIMACEPGGEPKTRSVQVEDPAPGETRKLPTGTNPDVRPSSPIITKAIADTANGTLVVVQQQPNPTTGQAQPSGEAAASAPRLGVVLFQGQRAQQSTPRFESTIVTAIAASAREKGIGSIYFIVGGKSFSSGCDTMAIINFAWRQLSQPPLCTIELGASFEDEFFASLGIKGGLRGDTLYVLVNPKYERPSAEASLVYQHWTRNPGGAGYLIATAMAPRPVPGSK